MATLTVWRFDTTAGAGEAADILADLERADVVVIQDAATVEWEVGKRKPKTRQLTNTTVAGALGGGFWGLLFGLIFFVPLLGAAIGAATGAITGSLTDVGIDDRFINLVRDQVTPGTSALFVLTSDADVDRIAEAFVGGPQGELIHTDLTPEQEAALREIFSE
ncbi:DUF1269 domain-containing protein [Nocardioides sp.]|uniref:DUF1269 domain-containing protein n=1 Tax=Nocardioides sp. TaxID=35761 RepID=UPI0037847669